MARSKKATAEGQAPAEAPKAGRKGKQAAPPAEAAPKHGRQKDLNLPQPGTPEYKKAAAERAEKFHEKTRAIRDLTRQHGMGVMELAKYCGFPDERGFRPLGGPEIRALFAQAKAEGKVTHAERPAEEWQVRRGRAKAEGAAAKVKKATTGKKATTPKSSTKSAGKASDKATTKKTEGRATPKTGAKTATKGGGKRGKKVEEPQGSMSVAEAINAPFSALREAVADEATGELEVVVVPDEEVYGPGEQPEGPDDTDMQAEESTRIMNVGFGSIPNNDEEYENSVLYPDKPELDPAQGGEDAAGFFDTKLGQETAAAEDERDGTDELAAATLGSSDPSENGHDAGKANGELAEWLKAQKPESEKMKLARAFYQHHEEAITSRQAAEYGGVSLQTNHSGRVVELSKAGLVEAAGEDDKKTRTWKITDAAIEAWEEVFGVS